MIYIALKRGTGFYSWLIRLWTRSRYSHVAVGYVPANTQTDETTLYEATAKHGVLKRTMHVLEMLSEGYKVYRIKDIDEAKIIERLERHIGDKYDWWAIFFSRIIPLNIQHRKQWYCFEYVAWALGMKKAWRWTGRTFEKFLKI